MKKVRANLTLGVLLKKRAANYATSMEMDLSELVSHLLREELANPTIGQKKQIPFFTSSTVDANPRGSNPDIEEIISRNQFPEQRKAKSVLGGGPATKRETRPSKKSSA